MIEHLDGNYETVTFKENLSIRIHDNYSMEDFPPHWHTPLEIIQIVEQDYCVSVADQDYLLKTGDIALIMPGSIHTLHAPGIGFRRIFLADISLFNRIAGMEATLSLLPGILIVSPAGDAPLHRSLKLLLAEINSEYHSDSSLGEPLIFSRLLELFVLLGRKKLDQTADSASLGSRSPYSDKMLQVCDFIGAHCTEDLTLDEAASLAGFSKYHFSRLFKDYAGVSFYQYLSQKRITNAEKLLMNPDLSITEAALHSGFTSLSSFIRMFRIQKGCTPTQYRDMYASDPSLHGMTKPVPASV